MTDNINKFRNDFYKTYYEVLIPMLKLQNAKRLKQLRIYKIFKSFLYFGILLMGCSLLLPLMMPLIDEKIHNPFFMLFLPYVPPICLVLSAIGMAYISKNFERESKEKIMGTVCKCFGNFMWSSKSSDLIPLIESSKVLDKFSTILIDDVFTGQYNDTSVDIVEALVTKGSGKNKTTLLRGAIVILDFGILFDTYTVVKHKRLFMDRISEIEEIKLEDPEFSKDYKVYSDDQIEARCLLTPVFMEKLKYLQTSFYASSMDFAFYGSKLIIALNAGKDLFRLFDLYRPMEDSKQFQEMFNEFVSIIKLVDYFKSERKFTHNRQNDNNVI